MLRYNEEADTMTEDDSSIKRGGVDWAYRKGTFFSPEHFRRFVFPELKIVSSPETASVIPRFRGELLDILQVAGEKVFVGFT